jgi:hypothetical protein
MPEFVGRLRTPRLASAPSAPVVGEVWYDTTNNVLRFWNGSFWRASPRLVNALPGSPSDGDEIYFQNAGMATDGIAWTFRYRAGGGTYKWEFVGGPSWCKEVAANENAAVSVSYSDFATVGPTVTAPLAGDYMIAIAAFIQTPTTNSTGSAAPAFGATAAIDADRIVAYNGNAANLVGVYMREMRRTISAAATAVKLQGRSDTAVCTVGSRSLSLLPIRVG